MIRALAAAALVGAVALPAAAEPLTSVWSLEPVAPAAATATFGQPFLEQRLLPFRLARLKGDAAGAVAGTLLFLVYGDAGRIAFCTFKDASTGHVAKSLFIPALDKRPCFVDADGDGRFEASFSVFDKMGSLAPSGDLSRTQPLAPVGYELVDPHLVPLNRRLTMALAGKRTPEAFDVEVRLDRRGDGKFERLVGHSPRTGKRLVVLNTVVTVQSVAGDQAQITADVAPGLYMKGGSNGTIEPSTLPVVLQALR